METEKATSISLYCGSNQEVIVNILDGKGNLKTVRLVVPAGGSFQIVGEIASRINFK